jgi:hypothetical protein
MRTMEAAGRDDRGIALKHASLYKSLANVEKRCRGQLQGLRRTTIVQDRRAEESRLQDYLNADPERREKAGGLLREIGDVYHELTEQAPFELNFEQLRTACRSLSIAFSIVDAVHEREKDDLDREPAYMERNFDQTKKSLRLTVDDLHLPTDTLMLSEMLTRLGRVNRSTAIRPLREMLEQTRDRPNFLGELVGSTKLNDWVFVESVLGMSPQEFELVEDKLLQWMHDLYPHYLDLRKLQKEREGRLEKGYGSLIDAKQQFLQTRFIPDANATLRFTHGTVRGYSPQDGIIKTPQTTLRGIVEKTTGVEPFDTPERLMQLHAVGDFGGYVHPRLQQVPVAMLYDTDTTGGNSGSPVFNRRGELVGVNFDRTFEATINDFAWNSAYSRSIGVDIRYCLWVIDRVYNAEHLIREMLAVDR